MNECKHLDKSNLLQKYRSPLYSRYYAQVVFVRSIELFCFAFILAPVAVDGLRFGGKK